MKETDIETALSLLREWASVCRKDSRLAASLEQVTDFARSQLDYEKALSWAEYEARQRELDALVA